MASTPTQLPNGTKVRISGDRRYPKDTAAIVLDNRAYPLYQVRIGTNQYDTKAPTAMVAQSKLDIA